MATGSGLPDDHRQPPRPAAPVAWTNTPDVLPILPDEVALIVLHVGTDLAAILSKGGSTSAGTADRRSSSEPKGSIG